MSKAWVVDPRRIRLTLVIAEAWGLSTLNEVPYATAPGAWVITGRAPWKR
jgi:hypothetical protein